MPTLLARLAGQEHPRHTTAKYNDFMHPNSYLRTYWRRMFVDQVFVAMSFDRRFDHRFKKVIQPAVTAVRWEGRKLSAYRVDLSRSGDSILTDIMDGIAHSRLILADVSVIGRDGQSDIPFRNGNVMYEIGVALASRRPEDVLIIRDDTERFLFDVSTIPHATLDFSDVPNAIKSLASLLQARLAEQSHLDDARTSIAVSQLTPHERLVLKKMHEFGRGGYWGPTDTVSIPNPATDGLHGLLEKDLIICAGVFDSGPFAFTLTEIGWAVAERISKGDTVIPATTST